MNSLRALTKFCAIFYQNECLMDIYITLGNWEKQSADARAIREHVFIIEQSIPVELEWDEMDVECLHAIAYKDGKAVGTGRLLPDGHIGRMAVLKAVRGAGVGGELLQALMREAKTRGDQAVILHAQKHAASFYQHHGFFAEGEEFMEAGIAHILMRCRFNPNRTYAKPP
jgi:predicted GNAT family N-acyltransferase